MESAATTGNPSGAYANEASYLVTPYAQDERFFGALLVAEHGIPIYRQAFGFANKEWAIPNSPDTRFRIGSITKQFTAAAILLLAEQAKLRTEDHLAEFYCDAPPSWGDITIHQLLTHSSGVPSYVNPLSARQTFEPTVSAADRILRMVSGLPLEFPPGSQYSYSNTGYVLLGGIVERASGQSYEEFLRSEFFAPLCMLGTGYDWPRTVLPYRASGYVRDGNAWKNANFTPMLLSSAAGGLYSTVDDLKLWCDALFTTGLLNPNSHQQMFNDYGHGYGYGWHVCVRHGRRLFRHGGNISGFLCELEHYPDDSLTIIALSNFQNAYSVVVAERLAELRFGSNGSED